MTSAISMTYSSPPPSPLGPGDDTQLAWSTRHAALPNAHWITLKGAIDHMLMMEYHVTQQAIAQVL